jgi:hypothetical protein
MTSASAAVAPHKNNKKRGMVMRSGDENNTKRGMVMLSGDLTHSSSGIRHVVAQSFDIQRGERASDAKEHGMPSNRDKEPQRRHIVF